MQQPPMIPAFEMGISPKQLIEIQNSKKEFPKFLYTNKFKSAVYAFILFILLSHKISYKITNIIFSIFTSRNDIINENGDPLPLGIFINAFVLAILIFIF
jgi:hypothetical protein